MWYAYANVIFNSDTRYGKLACILAAMIIIWLSDMQFGHDNVFESFNFYMLVPLSWRTLCGIVVGSLLLGTIAIGKDNDDMLVAILRTVCTIWLCCTTACKSLENG